ncbi:unnamed protein product [Durusdinium trenchii]|uniref:Uncharacterized protein n=1 Tax=Durusdinium trenchii TaxID=1381693 RepID=A0ABP0QJA3_9DINO
MDSLQAAGLAAVLDVLAFPLLFSCGLEASAQLVAAGRRWRTAGKLLPKVAEALPRGLCVARADVAQLLRLEGGEWHEEELPEGAPTYLNCAASFFMEQLFVVGGSGPWFEGCVPFAQSLELSSRCWQSLPSMAIARSHCAAVGAEDCLLVLGGQDGHPLDVVEALLSPGDIASCSWECRKPLPEALSDCSALYHPSLHRLVLLGHPRGTSARLQIRDAACGTWKSWKLPSERWNPALAQCSRYLLVIGGLSLEDEDVGSVDVFDLRTNAWSELRLPELLQPRSSAMACGTTSGRIFVLGGQQVGPVEYVEALDLWDCAWRRCADLPEPFACRATAIAAMD